MNWAPSPEVFSTPIVIPILDFHLALRWYSLMFMLAFGSAYLILKSIFKKEGWPKDTADNLLVVMILSTIIGARLGHCLFYQPEYYLFHPWEILMVWKGGLASHGGAVGIILGCYWFAKKDGRFEFLRVVDRVALVIPLSGMFVRIGNFFNSEILGKPSELPWAVTFTNIDSLPRHPAQLYEAASYLVIFGLMLLYYRKRGAKTFPGSLFGLCLLLIFSVRFGIEFLKENQVSFESELPINMGQILSIPVALTGAWLFFRSKSWAEASPVIKFKKRK